MIPSRTSGLLTLAAGVVGLALLQQFYGQDLPATRKLISPLLEELVKIGLALLLGVAANWAAPTWGTRLLPLFAIVSAATFATAEWGGRVVVGIEDGLAIRIATHTAYVLLGLTVVRLLRTTRWTAMIWSLVATLAHLANNTMAVLTDQGSLAYSTTSKWIFAAGLFIVIIGLLWAEHQGNAGRQTRSPHALRLKVKQAKAHDVYRDVVRIPEPHRLDFKKRAIKEGSICWVKANGRQTLAWVRGTKWDQPDFTLDELLRRRLNLEIGATTSVELRKANIIDEIRWGLQASEAAYRVATLLALISVSLGMLSVVLAFSWLGLGIAALLASGLAFWHHLAWLPRPDAPPLTSNLGPLRSNPEGPTGPANAHDEDV